MNKKTVMLGLLAILASVVGLVWLLRARQHRRPSRIEIGAVLPLTGSAAVWGQNVKKGMDLALDQVNAAGGVRGRQLQVLYEDSEGLPRNSVSALTKLIDADGIQVAIGDVASSSVLSMAPIANARKVVILSPGASNPDISHAGPFVFRNWHSDAQEGVFLAEVAFNKLRMRQVSIIYVNNGYGKGLEEVFSKRFAEIGGKIRTSQAFDQGATDFRAQLTRIKSSGCDGIFMPGYPQEMPEVLKQAKELGITKQFLCPSAFEDQQTLNLAGPAAEGVIYDYPKQGDLSRPYVANFYKDYQRRYGTPPGALSDTGYDALMLIVQAMKTSGLSGTEIQKGLRRIKNYPGVAGDTTFDEHGDIVKEFVLKTVKGGEFVTYEHQ